MIFWILFIWDQVKDQDQDQDQDWDRDCSGEHLIAGSFGVAFFLSFEFNPQGWLALAGLDLMGLLHTETKTETDTDTDTKTETKTNNETKNKTETGE